ncbi:Sodium-coupled monocarboxylate transporter 1 [Halocaridina rubra]|uniref:Sodium-coupled monocarboxylate transporter 1 n=1 Tax=Halocaridina rubra TaxID=373956 RepID=A0AAN9A8E8_HALRR
MAAHYLNLVALLTVFCCVNFMGVAIYAVYADCDPMATGEITKPDQIVPYYVDDKLSFIYGIPGLFMASLYAGGLSSYSSQINAVSAVMWEDFFKNSNWVAKMSEKKKPLVNVGVSVITGIAGIVAGIVASQLGGVFQVGQTILGTIHAPLLGLFILGMCCPYANKIGGTTGFSVSLLFNLWVTIGTMIYGKATPALEYFDDGCENPTTDFNSTFTTTSIWTTSTDDGKDPGE